MLRDHDEKAAAWGGAAAASAGRGEAVVGVGHDQLVESAELPIEFLGQLPD